MLDQEELKKFVHYNKDNGVFTRIGYFDGWGNFINKNKKLTTISKEGYIIIMIKGKPYKAHRLVHLYVDNMLIGDDQEIDHIDGNRSNNKYSNLRIVSKNENLRNKKIYKNNTTGYIGVCKYGHRYRARINVNGVRISLGLFDTEEEAAIVRKKYEQMYNYHKNHGRNT